jgi:DNA-directed RNA polymerase specialized sigma24 family protein
VQKTKENEREKSIADLIDSKRQLDRLLYQRNEIAEELRSWFRENLPPRSATMLEYKYIDGLNNKEIADMMFYSYQTTRSRMGENIREARMIYERGTNE